MLPNAVVDERSAKESVVSGEERFLMPPSVEASSYDFKDPKKRSDVEWDFLWGGGLC